MKSEHNRWKTRDQFGLTPRQSEFARLVVALNNRAEAARQANRGTAQVKRPEKYAHRAMKNPKVLAAIAYWEALAAEQLDYTLEETLQALAEIAFVDPQDYYGPDGSIKALGELTKAQRRAVEKYEEIPIYRTVAGEQVEVGSRRVIHFHHKLTALGKILEYHLRSKEMTSEAGKIEINLTNISLEVQKKAEEALDAYFRETTKQIRDSSRPSVNG